MQFVERWLNLNGEHCAAERESSGVTVGRDARSGEPVDVNHAPEEFLFRHDRHVGVRVFFNDFVFDMRPFAEFVEDTRVNLVGIGRHDLFSRRIDFAAQATGRHVDIERLSATGAETHGRLFRSASPPRDQVLAAFATASRGNPRPVGLVDHLLQILEV